jgi:hypothetical protein
MGPPIRSKPQPPPTDDEAAIEQIGADYVTHYNVQVREVRQRSADRYAGSTSQQIEIHDVGTMELAPGWAHDGGWWVVTDIEASGPVSFDGTYMHLMRQQEDGSWKIHRAVVNGSPTLPT